MLNSFLPVPDNLFEEEKLKLIFDHQIQNLSEAEIVALKSQMDHKQSYLVTYQCSRCLENYQKEVRDNSWYTLRKDICPICLQDQIPFVDIELPNNARKLDPNVQPLFKSPVERNPDQIEFDVVDEQYFTLPFAFDEVLFLVSKKESILRDRYGYAPEREKRLFELAEKIDLQCYALFLHSEQCSDSSCLPTQELGLNSQSNDDLQRNTCEQDESQLVKRTTKVIHPTERQSKLCEYTKNLLNHCTECCLPSSTDKSCTIYNCAKFRDILEYHRLFHHTPT